MPIDMRPWIDRARVALSLVLLYLLGDCSLDRAQYTRRSRIRLERHGPTPPIIWPFSSAHISGFHFCIRSMHFSTHTSLAACSHHQSNT